MPHNYPCVVTIAGTDPSGGAGIQADIKVMSAIGCYAASVVTALVAQNTQGVLSIQAVPPAFVKQQMDAVFDDLTIAAVKIGMLQSEAIMQVISHALAVIKPPYVVLDPVMVAKSGHALLDPRAVQCLKDRLFPLVSLVTPNLLEAEKIVGKPIQTLADMEGAAKQIGTDYKINVLIKGGHFNGVQSSDVLYSIADNQFSWFHAERVHTNNTHGTGCSLSSAIASFLAKGCTLHDAIFRSKNYLTKAIQAGSHLKIGQGCGPINHFYFMANNQYDLL